MIAGRRFFVSVNPLFRVAAEQRDGKESLASRTS